VTEAWKTLAQNYAKFDTPLRPNGDTVAAIRTLAAQDDPLVVVLGGTPIFAEIAERVWFIDSVESALALVPASPGCRIIQKNWFNCESELLQADLIVGDGSINALDSVEVVDRLLELLVNHLKPGAVLAQRIFVAHELSGEEFLGKLKAAFRKGLYSEVRFLLYGVVSRDDGLTSIADVDIFIDRLEEHLEIDRQVADDYKKDYFRWRGMTPAAAKTIGTMAFFPHRETMASMFESAGLECTVVSSGGFPLAEYTPIFTARG
jgi:hypothetical protein